MLQVDPALCPVPELPQTFPLARPLPSTSSAEDGAPSPLFGGFLGTMDLSDFSPPCIIPLPFRFETRALVAISKTGERDLPIPVRGGFVHAQGLRPRGVRNSLAIAAASMLLSTPDDECQHPRMLLIFRGSISWPARPLSTLRPWPHDHRRMTRGQCGSLLLHCTTLSFAPLRRFSSALSIGISISIGIGIGIGIAIRRLRSRSSRSPGR